MSGRNMLKKKLQGKRIGSVLTVVVARIVGYSGNVSE